MPVLSELEHYIKEYPSRSDKKIARHFKVSCEEVGQIKKRLAAGENGAGGGTCRRLKSFYARFLSGKSVLIFLFLSAAAARVIYCFMFYRNPILRIPLLDADFYARWAHKILEEGIIGKKIFFTEPLYAYLLALFLRISSNGDIIMMGFQVFAGSLLPIVIFKIGERVFNRPVGFLAGIICALYGPFIFYENLLLKTSLEVFFLSLFVLFLLNVLSGQKKSMYLGAGLFLGGLVLLKGNNLLLIPVIVYIVWLKKEISLWARVVLSLIFIIGFFSVIAPVTFRNRIVGKDFVLVNYSLGATFYQGNWYESDGALLAPPFMRPDPYFEEIDSYKMAEAYAGKELKPSEVSSFWVRRGLSEIKEKPLRWLALAGKKILLFINRVELSDNYDYALFKKFVPALKFLPSFWPVVSFGFVGMFLVWFSSDFRFVLSRSVFSSSSRNTFRLGRILLLSVVSSYAASVLIFHVNSRYRMPIVPFFAIFAAAACWYAAAKFNRKEYGGTVLVLAAVLPFFLLTAVHLTNYDFMSPAHFYDTLASYYFDSRDYDTALKYHKQAAEEDPKYAMSFSNLFSVYLRKGDFAEARKNLQEYIKLRPDQTSGYANLKLLKDLNGKPAGFINDYLDRKEEEAKTEKSESYDPYFYEFMKVYKEGDEQRAEELLKKSAEKFNEPENTLLNWAVIKKSRGDTAGAKELYEKIIQKNNYFLPAKYNLANIYLKEKDYAKPASLLKEVYEEVPEFGETWYYLGVSYLRSNNFMAAAPVIVSFVKHYENDSTKQKQVQEFKKLLSADADKK